MLLSVRLVLDRLAAALLVESHSVGSEGVWLVGGVGQDNRRLAVTNAAPPVIGGIT